MTPEQIQEAMAKLTPRELAQAIIRTIGRCGGETIHHGGWHGDKRTPEGIKAKGEYCVIGQTFADLFQIPKNRYDLLDVAVTELDRRHDLREVATPCIEDNDDGTPWELIRHHPEEFLRDHCEETTPDAS